MEAARSSDVSDVSDDGEGFDPWPAEAEIHVEWAAVGAALAGQRGDLVVIVDVLSFSTSVIEVAAAGGTALCWSPEELDARGGRDVVAGEFDALALEKARRVTPGQLSLSPASLATTPAGSRVVMTSLNGGRCVAAASAAPWIGIGALTNRTAVATRIDELLTAGVARRCTIVPCGETWNSSYMRRQVGDTVDSFTPLRPSVEDLTGAGAIVSAIDGSRRRSPEAEAAAAYVGPGLEAFRDGVSARELITRDFAADVEIAAEVDRWSLVPEWRAGDEPRRFGPVDRSAG